MLTVLLAGTGLAASAGLNAYLSLLVLALADRVSGAIDLDGPFDFLSSNLGIVVLLLLLPIELVGDKIPRLDHYNDLLHTVLRPVAGALCFAAVVDQDDDFNTWIAAVLGLAVAGGFHFWKMRARPAITQSTKGLGNPYASLIEDFVAIVYALVAVIVPLGVPVALALGVALLMRTYHRLVAGESSVIRAFTPRG